jgi:uncharacterized membrane protein
MNRLQKIAWSVVIMTLSGLILSVIAFAILYTKVGMPKAFAGLACMAIVGLAGFSPLIFRKGKGKITFDERDQMIKKNAAHAGFAGAFLFTCLACMIPFFVLGPKSSISVIWLPQIWAGTFITEFLFYSVAILVQYGWGGSDGEK